MNKFGIDANIIARFFNWNREVIEAAETPFAKLAIFVLPVLSPAVPAFMTGLHMFKLLQEMFTFQYATEVSVVMSFVIAIVLELLGYVGAIAFIGSLFKWVKNRNDEQLLPVTLNGLAYVFYLLAMWLINFQLGKYFGTAPIINIIFGLLSFITVPTGLLAANHLSQNAEEERDLKARAENNEQKLKRLAIKHGMNPWAIEGSKQVEKKEKKTRSASFYRDQILTALEDTYEKDGTVLKVIDLAKKFKLDYDRSKGFISGVRSSWMKAKGISKN